MAQTSQLTSLDSDLMDQWESFELIVTVNIGPSESAFDMHLYTTNCAYAQPILAPDTLHVPSRHCLVQIYVHTSRCVWQPARRSLPCVPTESNT